MSVSKIIKCIIAAVAGFTIGVAIAWLLNTLAMLLAGLIGKTATICLLWVISFALGFFGMRAYIRR